MRSAAEAGDGEQACSYLTARGQRFMARLPESADLPPTESCGEAVAAVAEQLTDADRERSPENVVTPDEVTLSGQGTRAEAASDFRGAMSLKLIDGEWLIDVPGFVD